MEKKVKPVKLGHKGQRVIKVQLDRTEMMAWPVLLVYRVLLVYPVPTVQKEKLVNKEFMG